jgi:hypothetical protein
MKSFILKLLKDIKQQIKNKPSFTLTEMLITVGILAVLSVTVLLTLNPQDLIKQSRDSQRLSDLTNLSKAIFLYEADTNGQGFMGTSSVVYVSIPDTTSTCANLGLPQLPPSWSYKCVSSSTLQNIDGTGWIPINFNNLSFGKTLSKLPIDPINTTSSGNYYTYTYDNGISKYELNANLESSKYKEQLAINDGGDNSLTYEIGSNLSITPTITPNVNTFIKVIGGLNTDYIYSIYPASDGGYIAFGATKSYGAGNWDGLIIKFNSLGNIQWSKTIGGSNDDYIWPIYQTSDGGYIAGGWTTSYGAGDSDAFIIKLNSSGNIQWFKTIGGSSADNILSISQTSDGGYIAGGFTYSYGTGGDAFIIKLNSSGNIEWSKAIGDLGISFISQTSDGGYIAGGNTSSYGAGNWDAFIIKLNSSGNIQWSKTIGGSSYDVIASISQASDGGYIAGGYTQSYVSVGSEGDAFIIKLNSSGNIEWSKVIGGLYDDYIDFIYQTSDGGYIAVGGTVSYGAGNNDGLIVKLNSSGNMEWSKTIGGIGEEEATHILQILSDGYIVVGVINTYGAGDFDGFIAKLDSSGNISNCSNIQSVNPQISSISPTVTSPSPTVNSISPTVTSPSPTVTSPSFQISNICPAQ